MQHRTFRQVWRLSPYREQEICLDCGMSSRRDSVKAPGPTSRKHMRREMTEELERFPCALRDDTELRDYVARLQGKYEEGGEYDAAGPVGEPHWDGAPATGGAV